MGQSEWRSVIMKFLLVLSVAMLQYRQRQAPPLHTVWVATSYRTAESTECMQCMQYLQSMQCMQSTLPWSTLTLDVGMMLELCSLCSGWCLSPRSCSSTCQGRGCSSGGCGQEEREADAEAEPEADADAKADADPYLFYSTHGYWPVGYSGLGHHLGYYGKREAEPEAAPEADPDADPWLLYGSHYGGHVYGGHYGYGYHHALPYYYLGGCRNYLGGLVPCA